MIRLGHSLKLTDRHRQGGWVDPLAGINPLLALRLQTHKGDDVPFSMYQDVACTVPATEEGDPIAAWRDELSGSGLVATQSDTGKQPILHFVSGVPTVKYDGVDDLLTLSSGISPTTTLTASFAAQMSNISGAQSVLSLQAAAGGPWIHMREGKTNLYNDNIAALSQSLTAVTVNTSFVAAVRLRTTGLDYFLDGPADGTYAETTLFTTPILDIGLYKGTQPFKGVFTAIALSISALSDPDMSTIDSYFATLNP